MARKRYKPEEIVAKLRQVDVLASQGQNMVDAIRQIFFGVERSEWDPETLQEGRYDPAKTMRLFEEANRAG
jgi:hypothetical protein